MLTKNIFGDFIISVVVVVNMVPLHICGTMKHGFPIHTRS